MLECWNEKPPEGGLRRTAWSLQGRQRFKNDWLRPETGSRLQPDRLHL